MEAVKSQHTYLPVEDLEKDAQQLEGTLKNISIGIRSTLQLIKKQSQQALDDSPMKSYIRSTEFFEEKLSDSALCLRLNWGKLKQAFIDAVTPIASVVVPVLNQAVVALTGVVSAVGQVIRALMGGIFQVDSLADSSEGAADAQTDLGKAVKSTGKTVKRSLAGFDELERMNASSSGSKTSSGTANTESTAVSLFQPIKDGLQQITQKLQELLLPLQAIDMTNLNQSLERLKLALEPLTSQLFSGLEWAWFNILVPIAQWTVEDFLPAFLQTLASALEALNSVITALKPVGTWLWENFLQPLGQWAGTAIIEALQWLKEKLDAISLWISENQELVRKIGTIILAVVAAVTLLNLAVGAFGGVGNTGIGIAGIFGNSLSALTSPMSLVTLAVMALVAAIALLVLNWDTVSQKASSVWYNIQDCWGKAYSWFKTMVLDPLVGGVKTMANGIIGYLNGMISAATKAVNTLIRAMNAIHVEIPAWVPEIGGKKLGFRLNTITCPSIPYLAQGAVLPANKPFLAMVGDQKHGTNIEAPLATIQEAVAQVMDGHIAAMLAGFEALLAENRALRQTVEGIELGDQTIGAAAGRYQQKLAVVRGY